MQTYGIAEKPKAADDKQLDFFFVARYTNIYWPIYYDNAPKTEYYDLIPFHNGFVFHLQDNSILQKMKPTKLRVTDPLQKDTIPTELTNHHHGYRFALSLRMFKNTSRETA